MPQDTAVAFDYTAREIVTLGRHPHHARPSLREPEIVDDALAAAGVAHLAARIHNTLSGGEKARVQLARALAQVWEPVSPDAPRWLLLDEPTAALDLAHQHRVMQCVAARAREAGMGVLAVLHDINLALRYADDAFVIDAGRLRAAGAAREVLTPALLAEVWGVRCHAGRASDGTPQYLFEGAAPQ
jgi:iron complex transport system ATP-binding protein